MSAEEKRDIETALDAGAALGIVRDVAGAPLLVVPDGYKVEDLRNLLPAPLRNYGEYRLNDIASFIELTKSLGGVGTRLFGTFEPVMFQAVLNDAGVGAPAHGDFSTLYAPPHSPEWKLWIGSSKTKLNQRAFAQFIEDNLPDIVEPASAVMLEASRTLEAKKSVDFAQATRLSNGAVEYSYMETIDGVVGKNKMQVPESFAIGIPVFQNGDKWRIECRLRYSIDSGNLTMWYEVVRPHKTLEEAVKEMWKAIEVGTGYKMLNGRPRKNGE